MGRTKRRAGWPIVLLALLLTAGLVMALLVFEKQARQEEDSLQPLGPNLEDEEDELLSVEEAREVFKTYRGDMEAVKEECEAKFKWINIDADEDGNLAGELQPKDGGLDTIVSINGENLSEYTEKADLIISLFKELQAVRISYTQETPNNGAIMAFDLKHTSVPNGNTGTRLPAQCGIVCSTERFGDYVILDGDWFYFTNIMSD